MNNSSSGVTHGVPLQPYGTDTANERYEYQRKIPALNVNTVATELKKKFYGNSTNRSASHIATKNRVRQIGIQANTLPIKEVNNAQSLYVQSSHLQRLRSGGCVVPKKCINSTIAPTPTFNGRSIAVNPGNPGGHSYYNVGYKRWKQFCVNDVATKKNTKSHYWASYQSGGTPHAIHHFGTLSNNIPGGVLQSSGSAKTYNNIHKRYIYQPYNPNGF
jgi:hypothetical protein